MNEENISFDEAIGEAVMENKGIIISLALFFITVVGMSVYNNNQIEKLNTMIEAKQEMLSGSIVKALEVEALLIITEAPKKFLEWLSKYRTETKEEMVVLTADHNARIKVLSNEVEKTEKQIRCQRAVLLWDQEGDCTEEWIFSIYSAK